MSISAASAHATPDHLGAEASYGIREVSERTGLTPDTLRWYEREGLLPRVMRGGDGRRAYTDREIRFVQLVVALRRTGMSVADARDFIRLADEGALSHGRRMDILEQRRRAIHDQIADLHTDLETVESKIVHYGDLIAAGLDCDGVAVPAADRDTQRSRR